MLIKRVGSYFCEIQIAWTVLQISAVYWLSRCCHGHVYPNAENGQKIRKKKNDVAEEQRASQSWQLLPWLSLVIFSIWPRQGKSSVGSICESPLSTPPQLQTEPAVFLWLISGAEKTHN